MWEKLQNTIEGYKNMNKQNSTVCSQIGQQNKMSDFQELVTQKFF